MTHLHDSRENLLVRHNVKVILNNCESEIGDTDCYFPQNFFFLTFALILAVILLECRSFLLCCLMSFNISRLKGKIA